MANVRSKAVLQYILEIARSEENFDHLPRLEDIESLLHDYEDIIFCWPTQIGWGESRVTNRSNGLLILTRHRLILVGSQPDVVRAALELSNVVEYNSIIRILRITSVGENPVMSIGSDPIPQAEEFHGWVYLEPADQKEALFIRQLCALPYSFVIHKWVQQNPSRPEMPGILQLPVSPDVLEWNRITIGYDALQEIARWLQSGRQGFYASELTQYFSPEEKVLFAAEGAVTIIPKDPSKFQNLLRKGIGFPTKDAQRIHTLPIPTYLLLTTERLFMISPGESKVFRLRQAARISFQSGIRGTSVLLDTESDLDEHIRIKFESHDKYERFFEALTWLKLDAILDFDPRRLELYQLDVLQPFFEVEVEPMNETGAVLEDLSRSGYIYILINPELGYELLKIGKTVRQSELRAKEIYTTGVPGEFVVAYEEHVKDCTLAESEIHKRLSAYRVTDRREFFRLPLKDAVRVVSEVAREVGLVPT